LPARSLREFLTFSMSAPAPTAFKSARAVDVLVIAASAKAVDATTRGTSGTLEMWCPRAMRRAALEEAARAEAVANRLITPLDIGKMFGKFHVLTFGQD